MKQGYITDIEAVTNTNTDFRRVLYTGQHLQLVVMSIEPGDAIGEETHTLDQFIRIEQGTAQAVLNGTQEHDMHADMSVIIPAGVSHNIINTGTEPLKLYSIYAPPEHKDGVVHPTKAEAREEHFDGVTTE